MSDFEIPSSKVGVTKRPGRKSSTNRLSDRITVGAEALGRLNQFLDQTSRCLRGIKLTRNELVNFLILNHPDAFSGAELKELEYRYFDEVKFAQWALGELKSAKARGETITLADIISKKATTSPTPRKKSEKAKTKETELSQ